MRVYHRIIVMFDNGVFSVNVVACFIRVNALLRVRDMPVQGTWADCSGPIA